MGNQALLLSTSGAPGGKLGGLLAGCGFIVQIARDIDNSLRLLRERPPAFVVIQTADATGIDACRTLRGLSDVPILVVCTACDEDLVVLCLEAGADSVLAAPLPRRELAARIGAMLSTPNGAHLVEPRPYAYRVGDLVIDGDAHVATKGGRALSLTPIEFRLLTALARRAGQVVSHAELLSEVWGGTHAGGPEKLRLYIRYLRQKLGDIQEQPTLLLNQRGVGYRLA